MAITEETVQINNNSIGKELRIRRLSKSFHTGDRRRVVINKTDLTVKAGEFLVILGPSGCGKSTLLRIIAGLEVPDDDSDMELMLDNKPIVGPGPDRGFVFQSFSSFPWLTAKQNILFGLKFCVENEEEREKLALRYLELARLSEYADYYPKNLSGGQQQRVAIARTLATKPQLLLMDEPYAALDAQNREVQQAELLRIWRETRPTIIFVTHDISEAAFLGQRVVVMDQAPASLLEEVDTEQELERKIKISSLNESATQQLARAQMLMREYGLDIENLSINHRGGWIRDQPEFYELVAKLKRALPKLHKD